MAPATNANFDPSKGVTDPHDINNLVFFVLFGLLGAAFVLSAVWFFISARNGGFHFRKADWDDYKTTVLRRRGPNGTLLSGATTSTNLGGGSSVYKDFEPANRASGDHDEGTLSTITAGASDLAARTRRDKRRSRKAGSTTFVVGEVAGRTAKDQLRSYRHERPARVGGLNRESDATTWDSSAGATPAPSSRVASAPATTGIRKVQPSDRRHRHRHRRDYDKTDSGGHSVPARRDFSFHQDDAAQERMLEAPYSPAPPPYSGNTGTKSYHHPMPELSDSGTMSTSL